MGILIIKNEECEGPGLLGEWLEENGFSCNTVSAFREKLPPIDGFDALVILGGPMGVYEKDRYPFLASEIRLIQSAIRKETPIMGICLGGQLLAHALGAIVEKNKVKEIGHFPIALTPEGKKSPFFRGFPSPFTAFQWHGDTFTIPDGALHLASSELCANQAFSFGGFALGLQFHLEADKEMAEEWSLEYDEELKREGIPPEKILSGFDEFGREYERLSSTLLSNFFR